VVVRLEAAADAAVVGPAVGMSAVGAPGVGRAIVGVGVGMRPAVD
jgi:hypothetical protein